jgi:hypothetical protein
LKAAADAAYELCYCNDLRLSALRLNAAALRVAYRALVLGGSTTLRELRTHRVLQLDFQRGRNVSPNAFRDFNATLLVYALVK